MTTTTEQMIVRFRMEQIGRLRSEHAEMLALLRDWSRLAAEEDVSQSMVERTAELLARIAPPAAEGKP